MVLISPSDLVQLLGRGGYLEPVLAGVVHHRLVLGPVHLVFHERVPALTALLHGLVEGFLAAAQRDVGAGVDKLLRDRPQAAVLPELLVEGLAGAGVVVLGGAKAIALDGVRHGRRWRGVLQR